MKTVTFNPAKVRSMLVEVELVNLPAGAVVAEYPLSSNTTLQNAVGILGVEAFNTTLQTKSASGKTNMPDAAYKVSYLSIFNSADVEVRSKIPLSSLIRSNGNSRIEPLNLMGTAEMPKPMDPQKSKVIIGDASTAATGQVVLLLITYVAP